jgi:TolA-binding protein
VAPAPPAPVAPVHAQVAPGTSEQVLLSRALHSLRSQRRPDDALAILDAYAARFPNGSLGPEAARLRTEALLDLGQKPAALAELNRDLGSNTVGAEENRLVRGELHANAGRWKDALLDFDAVARARLAREPSGSTTASAKLRDHLERALWGRASARSHLGDPAGAAADLRDYLQRFPRGRFAAQAGHLLGERR